MGWGPILDWSTANGLRIGWGRGAADGSFFPTLDHGGDWYCPVSVWTYGRVEVQFQTLQRKGAFRDDAVRAEFARRLGEIPGVSIPPDALQRRPSFALATLTSEEARTAMVRVLDWFLATAKAS